ncbi:MAG TPA: helix-turn-helix domain-containing protein [Syntrophales bacterium]|nr:helix-turn-helix domain-containing protein [Syntrophales bacterium]
MEETLGQYLRRKRESRLISLQEISKFTGISISLIKALEDDNFSSFPNQIIIAEYLKKCAAYLRLNEKYILRHYRRQSGQNHQMRYWQQLSLFSGENTAFEQKDSHKQLFRKRIFRGIFWLGIIIWVIVVVSLCILVLLPKEYPTEGRKMSASNYIGKEASYERNDRSLSIVEEKTGVSPIKAPDSSGDISPPASRNFISAEHDNRAKESGRHAQDVARSQVKVRVIGNRDSKRYHLPGMKYYDQVKSHHRVIFKSEAEAIKAGYSKARE